MAKHHPDLIFCRKQPGVAIGRCSLLIVSPDHQIDSLCGDQPTHWALLDHFTWTIHLIVLTGQFQWSYFGQSLASWSLIAFLFVCSLLLAPEGRLCEKCDGKCVICDSYVRPCTLVRICDECNYGSYQGRCVICGGSGVSDAYYCKECTLLEKDRDGCPKIVNLGSSKTDLFYERKKYGFKKR